MSTNKGQKIACKGQASGHFAGAAIAETVLLLIPAFDGKHIFPFINIKTIIVHACHINAWNKECNNVYFLGSNWK